MQSVSQRFAALVRAERARRRWRQQDLAEESGCSEPYIVRIEAAKVPHLSLEKAVSIANALHIDLALVQKPESKRYD